MGRAHLKPRLKQWALAGLAATAPSLGYRERVPTQGVALWLSDTGLSPEAVRAESSEAIHAPGANSESQSPWRHRCTSKVACASPTSSSLRLYCSGSLGESLTIDRAPA